MGGTRREVCERGTRGEVCERGKSAQNGRFILICIVLRHHNWGQALSSVFADHRHVTLGYNRYVAAGPPCRVVKTTGLNLSPFITCKTSTKPD